MQQTRPLCLLILLALLAPISLAEEVTLMTILDKSAVETDPLPETDPFPAQYLKSGSGRNWIDAPFSSDEFIVMVWKSEKAEVMINEPYGYDEYVEVLEGELVMTHTDGTSATFRKGDRFILQKGFTGMWVMTQDYRELIVVDTEAFMAAQAEEAGSSEEAGGE